MDASSLRRLLYDFFKFSSDFMVQSSGTGFLVRLATRPNAGSQQTVPWQLTQRSVSGGTLTFRLFPGTLNRIVPSNMFDDLDCSDTGTFFIILYVETNGYAATTVEIQAVSALSTVDLVTENTAPASFEVPVGIVKDAVYYQIEDTNLDYQPNVALIETRIPPSAGEEPFVRWWNWARKWPQD